mgnify:CR=1 FL=1
MILLSFVFDLIVDYTYQSLAFNYNSPIPSCIVHGLDVTPCQIYIYWPLGIVSSLTFLGFTVYSVVQKSTVFGGSSLRRPSCYSHIIGSC